MRDRIIRWLTATLIVLFSLGLLAVLSFFGWRFYASRAVDQELRRLPPAQELFSVLELDRPRTAVDPDSDAGTFYAEAVALLGPDDESEVSELMQLYDAGSETWPPDDAARQRAARLLERHDKAFELVDRAASLTECQYDLKLLGQGGLSRIKEVRELATLMLLRVSDLALRGDGDGASAAIESTLQLLRVFDRPQLVSWMVATGLRAATCKLTGRVLESRPTDAALARLDQVLSRVDRPDTFTRALLAERAGILLRLRDVLGTSVPEDWPETDGQFGSWSGVSLLARPMQESRMAEFLRDFRGLVRAARQPWPNVRTAVKTVRVESVFSHGLKSFADSSIDSHGRFLARVRAARVAVLAERYRRRTGRMPQSLPEIEAALEINLPLDPFSGGELIFRREAENFDYVIYSVGENTVDDGGVVEVVEEDEHTDVGIGVRLTRRKTSSDPEGR